MFWQSDRNDDQSGGAAEDLPEQRANDVPRDDRNDDVRHKNSKNQQKSHRQPKQHDVRRSRPQHTFREVRADLLFVTWRHRIPCLYAPRLLMGCTHTSHPIRNRHKLLGRPVECMTVAVTSCFRRCYLRVEGASCGEVSGRAAAHPASLISTCAGNSVPATEIADYGVGHPDKSSADRLGRRFEFLRQPFRRATGDYSTLTRHARRHSAGNSACRHVACHHRACANNGALPDTNPG